jgi:hypothetical protein
MKSTLKEGLHLIFHIDPIKKRLTLYIYIPPSLFTTLTNLPT